MTRNAKDASKYGLDYELRGGDWFRQHEGPDTLFTSSGCSKQHWKLLDELVDRGILEKNEAPAPYGLVAWKILTPPIPSGNHPE